jgi:hypothetical protein
MRTDEGDDTDLTLRGGDGMIMRSVGMLAVFDGVAPATFGLRDGVMRTDESDDTDLNSCGGDDMLMRGVGMLAVLDGVAPAVFGLPDGVAEPLRCGDGVPALLDAAAPACSSAGVVIFTLRFGVL